MLVEGLEGSVGEGVEADALRILHRTELNHVYSEYVSDPKFIPIDARQWRAVTVRDYGGGLVEIGYSSVNLSGPSPAPESGESADLFENKKIAESNLERSLRRSRAQVRRKCMAGGLDHLLTLTYRENMRDVSQGYRDFKRFVRLVRSDGREFAYVCVHEFQKRGAVHFHCAVRGWQDVAYLRACWRRVVGEGNIDVKAPFGSVAAGSWNRAKLASYLTKYICKETSSSNARQRYRVSEGIEIPGQTRVMTHPKYVDFVAEIFDSLGVSCAYHWKSPDGPSGWACSW